MDSVIHLHLATSDLEFSYIFVFSDPKVDRKIGGCKLTQVCLRGKEEQLLLKISHTGILLPDTAPLSEN